MTGRVLPREEWHRLTDEDRTFLVAAGDEAGVFVVEDGPKIVACVKALRVTHLEGLWIDPAYRGNASLGRKLIRGAEEIARSWPSKWVWAASASACMTSVLDRLGGRRLELESYVFKLEGV